MIEVVLEGVAVTDLEWESGTDFADFFERRYANIL